MPPFAPTLVEARNRYACYVTALGLGVSRACLPIAESAPTACRRAEFYNNIYGFGPVCDGSVSAVRYIGGQLSVNFSRCESATVMEAMAQQMKYKFAVTWAVGKSGDLQPIITDRA